MPILLTNKKAYKDILKEIRTAKNKIEIRMHIWRDDKIGNQLLTNLLKAADQGVKIHLRKDSIGAIFEHSEEHRNSMFHKKIGIFTRLAIIITDLAYPETSKGGKVRRKNFLVDKMLNHKNVKVEIDNFWDHTKYWLFDDKTLFITSMNVEEKHIDKDVLGREWRDNTVKITEQKVITQLKKKLAGKKTKELRHDIFVNTENVFEIKEKILTMLAHAKKDVQAHVAYWGDDDIVDALIACAKRGVDVDVLCPKNANISNDLNHSVMYRLFDKGTKKIDVFLNNNLLHTKILLVDDAVLLGSANFNKRGMTKVGEVNYYHKGNDAFMRSVRSLLRENKNMSTKVLRGLQLKHDIITAFLER